MSFNSSLVQWAQINFFQGIKVSFKVPQETAPWPSVRSPRANSSHSLCLRSAPGTLLPQGICTCSSLCLKCPSFRCLNVISLRPLLQCQLLSQAIPHAHTADYRLPDDPSHLPCLTFHLSISHHLDILDLLLAPRFFSSSDAPRYM